MEGRSGAGDARPESTSARYQLGRALAAKGELVRAREAFDAVIRAEGAEAEQARIEIGRLDPAEGS